MDLNEALEHWRAYRDPRLAELVRARSAVARVAPVAAEHGEVAQAVWLAREAEHDPADVPVLLETLPTLHMDHEHPPDRLMRRNLEGLFEQYVRAAANGEGLWFRFPGDR